MTRQTRLSLIVLLAALVLVGAAVVRILLVSPRAASVRPEPASASVPPDAAPTEDDGDRPPEAVAIRRLNVLVYYPFAEGDGLVGEPHEIFMTTAPGDRAKQILADLISGPATDLALRALPPGTQLRQVYVLEQGTAYVDFSEDLRRGLGGGSAAELSAVYAIVNSVALNIPEIRRVGILINGSPVDTLSGHVDLRRPLPPEMSIITQAAGPMVVRGARERPAGRRLSGVRSARATVYAGPVRGDGMDDRRHDGRARNELRPIKLTPGFLKHPPGSVLIETGETRVLCTATIEDRVPQFLHGSGAGWVTGEYAMIPAATDTRTQREASRGRPSGRTLEIQRLIGRALRSVVDRTLLGERTIWVDCEVLQADGGTRTASITGGYLALCLALGKLQRERLVRGPVLTAMLAAVSVGIVEGRPVLDLDYVEDAAAEVDMNVARTDGGRYVEVQGTAESAPFRRGQLEAMLDLADEGIERLHGELREVMGPLAEQLVKQQ